jgi:hypothetical protein
MKKCPHCNVQLTPLPFDKTHFSCMNNACTYTYHFDSKKSIILRDEAIVE